MSYPLALFLIGFSCYASAQEALSWEKIEQHRRAREQVIRMCLTTLKSTEVSDIANRERAAEILGEYRSLDAIPVLLSLINKFDANEVGLNAAQRALISIGGDILRPCLGDIAKGAFKKESLNLVIRVIEKVEPNAKIIEALISEMSKSQSSELRQIFEPFLSKWGHNFDA